MGKWTRRGFIAAGLTTGGVFTIGVALREGHRAPKLAGMMTEEGEHLINVWVKLSQDNIVTAIVPHSEMGQGVFTSMAQMLADEMDADWQKVSFEQAPAHEAYANYPLGREFLMGGTQVPGFVQDSLNGGFLKLTQAMSLQITGGSTAVRFTGQGGMRIAGAAARQMLRKAAARHWDVPEQTIRTQNSTLYHDTSGRSAAYAEFAEAASKLDPPTQPVLKTHDQYTLMGTSVQRFDIPSKVNGQARFGIDVDLPGLRYAAVLGPPVFGARVSQLDDTEARTMRGVYKIINETDFVAVIADSYWHAEQALSVLNVSWTRTGRETLGQAEIFSQFRADMRRAITEGSEKTDLKTGQARKATASAARRLEADYDIPYLAHAAMEPINATAEIREDKAEIWLGHQNPLAVRDEIAGFLKLRKHNVTVHNLMLGGGFGRRSEADYPLMAVRIARHADGPVKMIWSREQDTRQDFYRPATSAKIIAGLGEDGKAVSWDYQFVHKHDPPEASKIPYAIEHQLIHYAETDNPLRFGPWRSVDHTQHGFFIESFIDELAEAAGQDPLAYRRTLLSDKPRFLAVLDKVSEAAGWGRSLPEGRGLGVAVASSFGTIVAQIAEVDINSATPKIIKIWAAADPGFVVNPDGFIAQIESGIIYGLTAALYGNITVRNGAVEQSNFHDYPMLRIDEAPEIEVLLINGGGPLGGGGEPGTPPVAAAITNALFAATGRRVRTLPIDLKSGDLRA